MRFVKRINEGDILPKGYGVAWDDFYSRQAVCLPVGVNVLASIVRAAWYSIRHNHVSLRANPYGAYRQGFEAGSKSVASDK